MIINCGREGSAWSGGHYWADPKINELLTLWVQRGGGFIGIAESSARPKPGQLFQLSHVLGLDRDRGERIANGKYRYQCNSDENFITADLSDDAKGELDFGKDVDGIYVLGSSCNVLAEKENSVQLATNTFGKGRSVYLSRIQVCPAKHALDSTRHSLGGQSRSRL